MWARKKLKHLYCIHVFKTDHEFYCNTQHHHQQGHCQCVWRYSSEEKSLQGRQLEIVTTTTTTPPASTNKTLYKISEEKSKGGVTSSRSRDYEEEISVRPVLLFQPFLTSTNRFSYITTNHHNQEPPALTNTALHTTTPVTTTHHNQPLPTQPCSYTGWFF